MATRKRKPASPTPAFRLRVGHLDIRVYPWSDEAANQEDADGIYYVATDSIYIRASRSPAEQIRILIHEILHVIWDTWGMGDGALTEEEVCSRIDLGLVNVLRDNPHLLSLIGAALGPDPRPIF